MTAMKKSKSRMLVCRGFGDTVEKGCKAKANSLTKRGYPTTYVLIDNTLESSGNPPMFDASGFIEEAFAGSWAETN